MRKFLYKHWKLVFLLLLVAGAALRFSYGWDMEYKEDEEFNFVQTQLIGKTQNFPWVGMPSGVYIPNPGMSIWAFLALARFFSITDPVALAHAVQGFALLGIAMILPFAFYFLKKNEREPWLWAYALALVNPLLILYQRKLWPEPFLPVFCMLLYMGYWKREKSFGAFLWGLTGALLGQIHMSGFFFAFVIFIWTAIFDPLKKRIRWSAWFLGSALGALPLIPWFVEWRKHPTSGAISSGWGEMIQIKYWVFWASDSLGLHLGNALGLLRGESNWAQISDFVRYPVMNGTPLYLSGLAHLGIVGIAALIIYISISSRKRKPASGPTRLIQNSAFWGCGILLTLTGVVVRRYYLATTFPLEFIWIAYLALKRPQVGRVLLSALVVFQFIISASFVQYIHFNQGSLQGDYGPAYRTLKQVNGRTGRYNWDPHPPGIPLNK